ncbi:response regulator [Flavobacterium lacustre]|uniref:response regulator n=1 Tax=Flavobacterium lacustre TaxID=3016339 RepID=UPI0022B681DC|nr:response regulator [Flavobacterium lacustre]
MSKKIIWVVDDDAIYQVIIHKIIQKSEMFSAFSSFKNGKEAVSALHKIIGKTELIPDIILLDINMPVMDGWEFMEEIKTIKSQIDKKVIIYIVSSSIAIEDKNKSKEFNDVFAFISKPVNVKDIMMIAENS